MVKHGPEPLLLSSTALAALVLLPVGLDLPLLAVAAVLVLAGALYAPGNVVANAEIARLAPETVRGQVLSAAWSCIKAGQVAGGLFVAGLVDLLGAGPTIAASAGVLLFGTALLWMVTMRPEASDDSGRPVDHAAEGIQR
jgi:MFS family permease